MSRKKVEGKCAICGITGKLSFEHVPPKAAFNNNPFFYTTTVENIAKFDTTDYDFDKKGQGFRKMQGGIGYFSLCPSCNNKTGSWYGDSFVNWAYQSMMILLKANGKPTLHYPTFFFPLRVIKQVITMFFSLNKETFRNSEPYLVPFILDKEKRFLPPRYRLFCYYSIEGNHRNIAVSVSGNLTNGSMVKMTELAFPPFGFVLTLDSMKPDERLTEITHFADYSYNHWMDFYQKFNALPTHVPFVPGDYRSKEEVNKGIAQGVRDRERLTHRHGN